MTIAQQLKNLYDNLVIANSVTNEFVEALPDCYEAVEEKGGTVPTEQTASNLPAAIASIPSGGAMIDAGTGIVFYRRTYNSVQSTITERLKIVGGAGRQDWSYLFYNYGEGIAYADFPDISEMNTIDGTNFFGFYGALRTTGLGWQNKILPNIQVTNKCTVLEQFCYACSTIGIDTSGWDCSNVTNINNFFLYAYNCFSLIGEHTLQEVESGDIVALRGLAINFSFGSADKMRYSSMLAAAKGVADMTGQSSKTMTFNGTSWANQRNDDGSVPDAATIAARQSNIDAILTSKNWLRA